MIRNKIFMKIIFICMVMVLCLVCCMTEVKAMDKEDEALVKALVQDYLDDRKAVEERISSFNREETEDWLTKVKTYESENTVPTQVGDPVYTISNEEMSAVKKIKTALQTRLTQISGEEQKDNLDEEEMMDWSLEEIRDWLNKNNPDSAGLSTDLRNKWKETIDASDYPTEGKEVLKKKVDGATVSDLYDDDYDEAFDTAESPIYNYPTKLGSNDNAEESLEEVITDGNRFTSTGELKLDPDNLQNFSRTMYNILLAVGVAVAVIVGAIIGIKLMVAPIEERAEAKKLLVPYVAGCVIVFAGFGIWQLVVTILQGI